MGLLTLLTDYGSRDYYVAAVKGTVLAQAPETTLVDLSHEVPPGDVHEASFVLASAAPAFPPGTIHLAIVDPGVGSSRRILVARTREALLLAPDNGLLTPWLDSAELTSVTRSELFSPGPGSTFHGRDRFAPVAAALLLGAEPRELGDPVSDARRLDLEPPRCDSEEIVGHVVHIDRFGNLVTDIPGRWVGDTRYRVEIGDQTVERWVTHYAQLEPGQVGALIGSLDCVELSLPGASAAEALRVQRGDGVRLRRLPLVDSP